MRRKVTATTGTGPEGEIPQWVLDSGSMRGAIKVVGELVSRGGRSHYRYDVRAVMEVRREQEAAGRQWCAEQGLSYGMTVHGRPAPSESEAAVGLTRGAGPRYAAAELARRQYRR